MSESDPSPDHVAGTGGTPVADLPSPDGLSMLARRRIEAEMIGHVYGVLRERIGTDAAQQVIGESVRRSAIAQARRFAAQTPHGTSLQTFVEQSRLWEREDALRIEVRERTADTYAFDVVRCRYAEMYRDMGLGEIGHLLSCQRDGSYCEGYDPKLHMTRTQTIMQRADHCDFRYRYGGGDGGGDGHGSGDGGDGGDGGSGPGGGRDAGDRNDAGAGAARTPR